MKTQRIILGVLVFAGAVLALAVFTQEVWAVRQFLPYESVHDAEGNLQAVPDTDYYNPSKNPQAVEDFGQNPDLATGKSMWGQAHQDTNLRYEKETLPKDLNEKAVNAITGFVGPGLAPLRESSSEQNSSGSSGSW